MNVIERRRALQGDIYIDLGCLSSAIVDIVRRPSANGLAHGSRVIISKFCSRCIQCSLAQGVTEVIVVVSLVGSVHTG